MSKYNERYYIVFERFNEKTLYLTALQKSADRDYGFFKPKEEGGPLFFENNYRDEDLKNGICRPIREAHMNMNYVVVQSSIADEIKGVVIDGFQLFSSVIVDDKGVHQDNYWLMNIYSELDCLDYEKCVIDDYDEDDDDHEVEEYFLSDNVLDEIEESRRLIFRPKNTDMGYTFFHQKIVDTFNENGKHDLVFVKVSEYEAGKEFE